MFSRVLCNLIAPLMTLGLAISMRYGLNQEFFPFQFLTESAFVYYVIYTIVVLVAYVGIGAGVFLFFRRHQINFGKSGIHFCSENTQMLAGHVFNLVPMMICLLMTHYGLAGFIEENYKQ